MGSLWYIQQTLYKIKDNDDLRGNALEIRNAMNPSDLQEPHPDMLQKMILHANVDGDSDSNSEKTKI